MPMFKVGDKVHKPLGYPFDGVVRSVFTTSVGETRLVVELDRMTGKGDMLHIFSPKQLKHRVEEPETMRSYTYPPDEDMNVLQPGGM